jgi:alpha-amylase
VTDYSDQHNVQYCDLVGLPDLCTGCSYVQDTLGKYLNDLASLGVKGFRVDAAKHQEAGELGGVLSKGPRLYTFHEVIEGANEAVRPDMYYGIGQVTEFDFSRKLSENVKDSGKMGYLDSFGESWGLMPSEHAVVFIDNHDTQRGEAQLTYKDGATYTLATVFMLAHPYGYPKVMSSYAFSNKDDGPPSSMVHSSGDLNCGKGQWVCEHREPQIAGMVAFRKAVGDQPVQNFQKGQNNDAIAFSRGSAGFVVLNRSGSMWSSTLKTGLPAKEYTDVLGSGVKITVQGDGTASFSVPAMTAVALHV